MQNDQPQHDGSFDRLDEIVARINAEPVPAHLKDSVRLQIADQLKSQHPRPLAKRYVQLGVAMVVVAASVAFILFSRPSSKHRTVTREPDRTIAIAPEFQTSATSAAVTGPSLWSYHRAANTSLDDLDGLLAEHAAVVLTSGKASASRTGSSITSQLLEEI